MFSSHCSQTKHRWVDPTRRFRLHRTIVKDSVKLALALLFALLTVSAAAAPAPPFLAPKIGKDQLSIDFAGLVSVIDLKDLLTPYSAPAGRESDGSRWYLISATNGSVRSVARVLMAGDPPDAALHIFPRRARPQILQVASSDSGVTVERGRAVGRHAFVVTVPPATSVSLAVRVANMDEKPSVLAWNEPALVAHNRLLAVFLAAVAGLIAAAVAIMAGVAVITSHPAPGWTALLLLLVFLTRLQGAEVLDAGWMTAVGGPYGLGALIAGCALAAALRLTDLVAPITNLWPAMARWRRTVVYVVLAVSFAAFLGVPAATMLTDTAVVVGTALIAAYLVHRGLQGSKAARVVAPSAAVFALVAAMGALAALGAFQQNPMASGAIAGFSAAGAVLLALAIAAGEGIAILPLAGGQLAGALVATEGGQPTPSADSLAAAYGMQAVGAAHQGVFDLDLVKGQLRLSREAAWMTGLGNARTIAHDDWLSRIHADDRQVYADALKDYRAHPGLAFRMEFRVLAEKGRRVWLELRATMLGGNDATGTRCLGLVADVTARKESEATPGRLLQDALTGLGNRVALVEQLEKMQPQWNALAFGILDIDRFKAIHASVGDEGGDQLLSSLAARLTKKFTAETKCFRIGGDSFAVIAPASAEWCARLGTELVDVCAAPFSINGRNIFASASAGVVPGSDAEDPIDLIKNAEFALGLAKRRGGGCSKVFVRNMEELARGDAVALETDLRRGLGQNEFSVHYQPIIRLADNSVAGFEALLRWQHPEKGLVSPTEFIAHSEETGLIISLGRFALERAASDLADWQRYFPVDPPLFASVNVSRRQLRQETFASSMEKLLAAGNFAPDTFKLEVTESAIEIDAPAKRILARLRNMGAGLAIDDFGTGLSTLSQLKDLPFDTVKIDKSFLGRRTTPRGEADATAVMTSVVELAHELKRTVVVEGVESERDAIWLQQLGCEFAQGFYFSHPLPAEEALKYIANHFRLEVPPAQWPSDEEHVPSSASGVG
jgi:diguanylate cyclase (GGDEF)-like protein/PAS domain S-box-containing protein